MNSPRQRLPWTKSVVSGGQEYQLLDPLSRCNLRFPNRLHRDNFLVQFGESHILNILIEQPTISIMVGGQVTTTRFDATVVYSDGRIAFQEVKPSALIAAPRISSRIKSQIEAQRLYARTVNSEYQLRTEVDIYRWPLLIDTKQRMRQILAQYMHDSLTQEIELVGAFVCARKSTTVAALMEYVAASDPQLIEAAIYRLYVSGHITLNITEARYGAPNSIASVVRYADELTSRATGHNSVAGRRFVTGC